MKVVWSENARNAARNAFRYIHAEFGEKAAQRFLQEIDYTSSLLESNPRLGHIEPYLQDYAEEYRSIVVSRLNKMVYYINGETIEIVALWDTRREPKITAQM